MLHWMHASILMAPLVQRRCLFCCVLLISALVPELVESSVVKEIAKLKQVNDIPKLTHITIAGAIQDGQKEVEVWVETVAPGGGTPIHRHDCEEIFVIQKGGGNVYIAPPSDNKFPGEPVATSFSANSTFSIPPNAVHHVTIRTLNAYPTYAFFCFINECLLDIQGNLLCISNLKFWLKKNVSFAQI